MEGGYLAPVYEAALRIPNEILTGYEPVKPTRAICSAIYYFLTGSDVSVLRRVWGDMLYHFYAGDPVEMVLLDPDNGACNQLIFSN